jgi:nucleoside-diphosphate-sugar epimerase
VGITGGNGRIGRTLAKAFASSLVRTSSRSTPQYPFLPPIATIHLFTFDLTVSTADETVAAGDELDEVVAKLPRTVVDLTDENQLKGKFAGLDVVIHLAAYTHADPFPSLDLLLNSNVRATYNVLQECVRSGVRRLIFASTNHTQHGLVVADPAHTETLDWAKIEKNSRKKKFWKGR